MYSGDKGLIALARGEGLKVLSLGDLPLPPIDPQADMFNDRDDKAE
jgi:hypothetical protein